VSGLRSPTELLNPQKRAINTTKFDGCLENFPIREWFKMGNSGMRARAPHFVSSCESNDLRMKARNRLRFLGMNVENRVQLGDLQEVGNFLIQIQEL
jgi:hypothetical protein